MTPLLSDAIAAVTSVQDLITSHQKKLSISEKADHTLVTDIDIEAEKTIRDFIQKKYPSHSFLGEEFGMDQHDSEYVWVLDPIDGTREYTRGLPLFSTLLALKQGDEFILGVSNAPALNELLYAQKGEGAWKNNEKIHVSKVSTIADAYILGPGYKYLDEAQVFPQVASLAKACKGTRNVGGFWGHHWLASGKADAVLEVDTNIYDIAPFICINREAGGTFSQLNNQPITLDSTTFLASNTILHTEIQSFFK